MVTKSEEENIMDKAVGSKIADYLIKPVNPNQVLLSIKKNVHQQQLVTEQTTADYRSEFGRISSSLQMAETFSDWCSLYRKLTNWEVELSESTDQGIKEAGTLKLVGTKMEDIYRECRRLLTEPETYRKMSEARNPYGDGTASIKIRKILEDIDA